MKCGGCGEQGHRRNSKNCPKNQVADTNSEASSTISKPQQRATKKKARAILNTSSESDDSPANSESESASSTDSEYNPEPNNKKRKKNFSSSSKTSLRPKLSEKQALSSSFGNLNTNSKSTTRNNFDFSENSPYSTLSDQIRETLRRNGTNPTLQQFNSTAALDAYLSPITADMFNSNTVPSGGSFYQSTTTTTTIQPQYNQINNQFGNPVPNPNSYQTGPNSYNPPSNPPNFQAPNFQAQNFQAVPKGAPPPPNKRPRLQKPKKSDFLKLPKNVLCSINSNDSFLHESHNPFFRRTPGFNSVGGILSAGFTQKQAQYGVNGKKYLQHAMTVKIQHKDWILTKENPEIPKRDSLILRIFEKSAAHKDYAPYGLEVKVNGMTQSIGEDIPVANTAQIPKPQPKCINLTNDSNVKSNSHRNFDLKICWRAYTGFPTPNLSWSVIIASRQHVEDAAKSITNFAENYTSTLIKSKFKGSLDRSELGMVEMKCKISCPLTLCKLTDYPVRFKNCTHVDCFDAIIYLKMNYKRPSQKSWKCPICQKHEPWETLKLCTWTKKVALATHSEVREVFLCEDGPLWKLSKDEENVCKNDEPEKAEIHDGNIQSLDSEDDSQIKGESIETSSRVSARSNLATRSGPAPKIIEKVICLDSSDEEEPSLGNPSGGTTAISSFSSKLNEIAVRNFSTPLARNKMGGGAGFVHRNWSKPACELPTLDSNRAPANLPLLRIGEELNLSPVNSRDFDDVDMDSTEADDENVGNGGNGKNGENGTCINGDKMDGDKMDDKNSSNSSEKLNSSDSEYFSRMVEEVISASSVPESKTNSLIQSPEKNCSENKSSENNKSRDQLISTIKFNPKRAALNHAAKIFSKANDNENELPRLGLPVLTGDYNAKSAADKSNEEIARRYGIKGYEPESERIERENRLIMNQLENRGEKTDKYGYPVLENRQATTSSYEYGGASSSHIYGGSNSYSTNNGRNYENKSPPRYRPGGGPPRNNSRVPPPRVFDENEVICLDSD